MGSGFSAAALALRTYAARQQLPHVWVEVDTPAGASLVSAVGLTAVDLPAVITPTAVLRRATPGPWPRAWACPLPGAGPPGHGPCGGGRWPGRAGRRRVRRLRGPGYAPAGLGRRRRPGGGQFRIENYLGFTSGISGADLMANATVQAQKLGRSSSPCQVTRLEPDEHGLRVVLADGTRISAHAVVIATGARYRALPLPRWDEFEGAGIYYAATELEARACGGGPVAVVGGANSAGQAALYLAGKGSAVDLVVRGEDLADGMSSYLADRILAHPGITVRTRSEVSGLDGGSRLELHNGAGAGPGLERRLDCHGLFLFHRCRARHRLVERGPSRRPPLRADRCQLDRDRAGGDVGSPQPSPAAVRDQPTRGVRRWRCPLRLHEAGGGGGG